MSPDLGETLHKRGMPQRERIVLTGIQLLRVSPTPEGSTEIAFSVDLGSLFLGVLHTEQRLSELAWITQFRETGVDGTLSGRIVPGWAGVPQRVILGRLVRAEELYWKGRRR